MQHIANKMDQLVENLESLIEKAELWQLVFDECPVPIAVITSNSKFFLVNNSFCELTNFTKDEVIGENISIVIPQDKRKIHKTLEKKFMLNPTKRVIRHGENNPFILTKERAAIEVTIDLSYITYNGGLYMTTYIRPIDL